MTRLSVGISMCSTMPSISAISISFIGRLEVEQYTLPLAELLLEKMQIVQINEKDIDRQYHAAARAPRWRVRIRRRSIPCLSTRTLSNDWGFWRTVTGNLKMLDEKLGTYASLTDEDRRVVHARIEDLSQQIDRAPKSLALEGARQDR